MTVSQVGIVQVPYATVTVKYFRALMYAGQTYLGHHYIDHNTIQVGLLRRQCHLFWHVRPRTRTEMSP